MSDERQNHTYPEPDERRGRERTDQEFQEKGQDKVPLSFASFSLQRFSSRQLLSITKLPYLP